MQSSQNSAQRVHPQVVKYKLIGRNNATLETATNFMNWHRNRGGGGEGWWGKMFLGGKSLDTRFMKGQVHRQYMLTDGKLWAYSTASRNHSIYRTAVLNEYRVKEHEPEFLSTVCSDSLKPNSSEVIPLVCSLLSYLTKSGNVTKWSPGGMAKTLFCYEFLYLLYF